MAASKVWLNFSRKAARVRSVSPKWRRSMSFEDRHASEIYHNVKKIVSASISAVSPPELVSKAVSFDTSTSILTVADQKYHISNNVKVVAFGKAVLGMVAALEEILGQHITGGVASIPVGAVETAKKFYPNHLPKPGSKIRLYEGAEENLPDSVSELASREVLSVARSCSEDDLLVALVSGGGSALLSCPVPGMSVEEKRKVIEALSRGGADIRELNAVRKAISQTKGGKLAEAAFPAKVLGLVLSDVIGDPLDVIASGPTVPGQRDDKKALQVLDKYGLKLDDTVHRHLRVEPQGQSAIRDEHVFNVVIGNNKMATESAKEAAIKLGYASYMWSVQIHGEAASLGQFYAILSHHMLLRRWASEEAELDDSRDLLYDGLGKLSCECPELEADISSLMRMIEVVKGGPFCLVGSGEPTVRVTGKGKGGRNQELALAYAIKLHELRESCGPGRGHSGDSCMFAAVGTDGQDGPCDAAGAMVDLSVVAAAMEQGLSPAQSLLDNDSYTFFSLLNSGSNLIKTGLTGTNVMDIHILLIK